MKTQSLDLSTQLGTYGHRIIHHNVHKFVEQEKAVLKDKDSEPLHQMRVGMRRLRTAIQVFGIAIVLPKAISSSSIGIIFKRLGETRDLDVLEHVLTTRYQPLLHKGERSKFDKVLMHLHHTRDRSMLHLKKTLNDDRYHKFKHALQIWVEHPVYSVMGDLLVEPMLPDLLLPLICELFLHPGWLVGTIAKNGKAMPIEIDNLKELYQQELQCSGVLHDLRKQMKRVRYQTEFFSEFYGISYVQRIEEFKLIQDILGQRQDHLVLSQFLESILDGDLGKDLPTVNNVMQQEQADFWQRWQPIQQRYLSSDFRDSFRSLLTTPKDLYSV